MKTKTTLFSIILFFVSIGSLLGQTSPQVAEEEVQGPSVQFQNRSARRAASDKRQQDLDLGARLGQDILQENTVSQDPFSVRRVFNPEDPGFGADVLTILPDASYGHINSIQRTIAGYLTSAFEYSAEDADILSRFILYYNARQRENTGQVRERYSEEVFGSLNEGSIGIDRAYTNWAGKTEILIPLRKNIVRPNETDVEDIEIESDAGETTEEEQEALNEVQAKRAEEDQQRLDEKEQELTEQKQDIQEEQKKVEEQKTVVQEQQQQNQEKIEELQKDPEANAEEIAQVQEEQQELEKQEEELDQQEQTLKEQEEQVTEQQQVVQQQQAETAQRQEQASDSNPQSPAETVQNNQDSDTQNNQTTDVAALQEEVNTLREQEAKREEQSENVVAEKILFLRVLRYFQGGHYNNELWTIDTASDDTLLKGPFTNICGREFVILPDGGVLVIGYTGPSHGDDTHNFVILDQEKLAVKSTSKESIFWRSPMELRDDKIYAFETFEGRQYLSRFNADLTLDARSSEAISADSQLSFFGEKIYLTGKAETGDTTTIKVFKRSDLSHLKTITPPGSAASGGDQ